jgi:hypothetical protein
VAQIANPRRRDIFSIPEIKIFSNRKQVLILCPE